MVQIPENQVTTEDITQWYNMAEQLTKLKAAEMLLRKKIFGGLFPNPKEGTNKVPLAQGWELKATHKIDRKIDPGALLALGEKFTELNISTDALVKYEPSLVTAEYRTLTEEQRQLFDQALIIKPGSPSLEIVLPAKAKKAGEKA